MNRRDLQAIARIRIREAGILLRSQQYPGAYYLLGYSIECALKAAIAKQTNRHDFPDKQLANGAHTHNLENLFKLSGLWTAFQNDKAANPQLDVNWAVVKDWSEASRYQANITQLDAQDLHSACGSPQDGIFRWIRARW